MKNLIIFASLLAITSGCTFQQAAIVKGFGCAITTVDGRAELRAKQKIKTNICQDDLEK